MRTLPLPDILSGLVLQLGWSFTRAGREAGISEQAVRRWCTKTPAQLKSCLRLLAAFHVRLVIVQGSDSYAVALPTPSPQRAERDRRAWRKRRFVHYINIIRSSDNPPRSGKRKDLEARARTYVANEEARLAERITAFQRRLHSILVSGEQSCLRAAITDIAKAAQLSDDQMAWIAGISSDAIKAVRIADDDGRIYPLRQLLTTVQARLEIHLPSGTRISIDRANTSSRRKAEKINSGTVRGSAKAPSHDGSQQRSSISQEKILVLYDAKVPITKIAMQAGISRQRVHAIAQSAGRSLRRIALAEERTQTAANLLARR